MCELFGYNSRNQHTINEYLKAFFKRSSKHPNGWGLACMYKDSVTVEKEPLQATKSHYLKERLSASINYSSVMAHIRYATVGNEEYNNCHPYSKSDKSGRTWTLIHNGTIFEFNPLKKYLKSQIGSTDTERLFLYIIDKMNAASVGRVLNANDRFEILQCIINNVSKNNKLNIIIYDGELMYVHSNYSHSLYYLESDDDIIFSTNPLTFGDWKEVPFSRLLAYKDGKLFREGICHGNEYIDNEKDLQQLYRNFSQL